jgi:hypothetical protein
MKMSKIGPDAEWSVCWSTGYGITAPQFKDFHPSRLKENHFSHETNPTGDSDSDNDDEAEDNDDYEEDEDDDKDDKPTPELIFGALLLTSEIWWVKEDEDNKDECRVEVDGKLACKWRKETAT